MTKTLKMLAIAGTIFGMGALAQSARADHIGLSVGMGVNVHPVSTTIINPSPVVYSVPAYTGAVYGGAIYGGGGYSVPYYSVPAYSEVFSGPTFGYEQTFYQPNFYYGGGYYQSGGVSSAPLFYGRQYYGGGGYYGGGAVAVPSAGYRTAPAWAGPRYNGMPSRLTFGPLSRW